MADSAVDAVLGLVREADRLDELVDSLARLDDVQRRACARLVLGEIRQHPGDDRPPALALVVLGCGTGVRQVAAALDGVPVSWAHEVAAVRVLGTRAPHWLPDLPAALLARPSRFDPNHVRLVRALVREGLVAPPQVPEYAERLVEGLGAGRWSTSPALSIVAALRDDPGVLDRDIWFLLTTQSAGRLLASYDRHLSRHSAAQWTHDPTWLSAFTTLAVEGAIDRDRLIDTVLGVFLADWAPVDVAWHIRLHDALAPTSAEMNARQATYARLLAVEHGPIAKLGIRSLTALLRDGSLDLDVLLESASAPLLRTDKATVWSMLTLLASVARAHRGEAGRVAEIVAVALQHPLVDVQERALTLLDSLVPDDDRRAGLVDRHAESLAPSLRPPSSPVTAAADHGEVAAADTPEPVQPVESADEVAELFGHLLEEADDPIAVERVLDGVLRFPSHSLRHGGNALATRALFSAMSLRSDLATLVSVWLSGWEPVVGFRGAHYLGAGRGVRDDERAAPLQGRGATLRELVTRRIGEVAAAVHAGGGQGLLSLPTSTDGSLSAEALNRRVAAGSPAVPPRPIDACLALLRVPPEEYDELRFPQGHCTGDHLATQLTLLRQYRPDWQLVLQSVEDARRWRNTGETGTALWRQVAWADRSALPDGLAVPLVAVLDRSDPLLTFGTGTGSGGWLLDRFEQVVGLWPLMLPHHPDLLAEHAHPRFVTGLHADRAGTEAVSDALGRTVRPIGGPALSALALGMAALDRSERTRSVDAVIGLTRREALDGEALGRALKVLLSEDMVVAGRVVDGLAEAARAEPRAADAVLDCLVTVLDAVAGRRDAHLFVDLLADVATERGRGVALPEPFASVAMSKDRSALARACRRVPPPTDGRTPDRSRAPEGAIGGR